MQLVAVVLYACHPRSAPDKQFYAFMPPCPFLFSFIVAIQKPKRQRDRECVGVFCLATRDTQSAKKEQVEPRLANLQYSNYMHGHTNNRWWLAGSERGVCLVTTRS